MPDETPRRTGRRASLPAGASAPVPTPAAAEPATGAPIASEPERATTGPVASEAVETASNPAEPATAEPLATEPARSASTAAEPTATKPFTAQPENSAAADPAPPTPSAGAPTAPAEELPVATPAPLRARRRAAVLPLTPEPAEPTAAEPAAAEPAAAEPSALAERQPTAASETAEKATPGDPASDEAESEAAPEPTPDGAQSVAPAAGATKVKGRTRPAPTRTPRAPRQPRERTPRTRTEKRPVARIVLAALTVAALGGTAAASSLLPLPRVSAVPVTASVIPAADGLRLACAGPLLQLTDAAEGDSAAVTAVSSPVGASGASRDVAQRTLTAALEGSASRAFAVESDPDPEGADVLGSAAQSQYGAEGLVGLVATACAAPAASFWLVGGSTEVGRTTLVNLQNPTDVAAVVDLTLVGEDGPVSPPGASGIAVPAGEQVVVPLSGLAPGLAAPVVQVESRGGRVTATLQQSIVRGIDPGGVDTFGATAAAAARQYIPGVRVANAAGLTERLSLEDHGDLATVVRLFVPGAEHTEVRIGVVPDDPGAEGASVAFHIEPDQVVDVPVEALADGSYTVTVDADLPVVAAVRQSQVAITGETDFAWLAAAEPIPADTETWVSVTPGPGATLFLHNPGADDVTGTLTSLDDREQAVEVPAGGTAVVPVEGRVTYRLQADGELRGAVSYLGDRGIAAYPVLPPPTAADPLTVYPG